MDSAKEMLGKVTEGSAAKVTEWLQGTEDFVMEQAPLLCREIVMFGIAKGLIGIGCGIALAIVVNVICISVWTCCRDAYGEKLRCHDGSMQEGAMLVLVLTGGCRVGSIIGGIAWVAAAIYLTCLAYFAPRLYILKEIAGLVVDKN